MMGLQMYLICAEEVEWSMILFNHSNQWFVMGQYPNHIQITLVV